MKCTFTMEVDNRDVNYARHIKNRRSSLRIRTLTEMRNQTSTNQQQPPLPLQTQSMRHESNSIVYNQQGANNEINKNQNILIGNQIITKTEYISMNTNENIGTDEIENKCTMNSELINEKYKTNSTGDKFSTNDVSHKNQLTQNCEINHGNITSSTIVISHENQSTQNYGQNGDEFSTNDISHKNQLTQNCEINHQNITSSAIAISHGNQQTQNNCQNSLTDQKSILEFCANNILANHKQSNVDLNLETNIECDDQPLKRRCTLRPRRTSLCIQNSRSTPYSNSKSNDSSNDGRVSRRGNVTSNSKITRRDSLSLKNISTVASLKNTSPVDNCTINNMNVPSTPIRVKCKRRDLETIYEEPNVSRNGFLVFSKAKYKRSIVLNGNITKLKLNKRKKQIKKIQKTINKLKKLKSKLTLDDLQVKLNNLDI